MSSKLYGGFSGSNIHDQAAYIAESIESRGRTLIKEADDAVSDLNVTPAQVIQGIADTPMAQAAADSIPTDTPLTQTMADTVAPSTQLAASDVIPDEAGGYMDSSVSGTATQDGAIVDPHSVLESTISEIHSTIGDVHAELVTAASAEGITIASTDAPAAAPADDTSTDAAPATDDSAAPVAPAADDTSAPVDDSSTPTDTPAVDETATASDDTDFDDTDKADDTSATGA